MQRATSRAVMGLDRTIAFFEVTDGRDKLAKCFQNMCRALAWHLAKTDPMRAAALVAVAKKLSEYRSVIKFFKWLKNIRDIRDLTWDDKIGDSVELAANFGDIFYRGFDNLQWLGLTKVVPYDPVKANDMSDFFQFWGYLAQFILVRTALSRARARHAPMRGSILRSPARPAAQSTLCANAIVYVPRPTVGRVPVSSAECVRVQRQGRISEGAGIFAH